MIIIVVWILLMHVYPDKDQTPVLYINVNQYKTKKKKKKKKRIIEAYSFSSPHAAINVHIVHDGKAMFIIVIIVYIIIMRVLE